VTAFEAVCGCSGKVYLTAIQRIAVTVTPTGNAFGDATVVHLWGTRRVDAGSLKHILLRDTQAGLGSTNAAVVDIEGKVLKAPIVRVVITASPRVVTLIENAQIVLVAFGLSAGNDAGRAVIVLVTARQWIVLRDASVVVATLLVGRAVRVQGVQTECERAGPENRKQDNAKRPDRQVCGAKAHGQKTSRQPTSALG
jgi:hypothetical protein